MRLNRKRILLNAFLFALLFLFVSPPVQPPLTRIAQLESGSSFLLCDYFDFDWDDVEIVNTLSRLSLSEYRTLVDAGWLDSNASPDEPYAQAVLAFYRDGVLCKLKLYDYSAQSVPVFCLQAPTPDANTLPTDHFAASRTEARFEIISSILDGEPVHYAILSI